MPAPTELPLSEWVVLCLVVETPRHGFALRTLTAGDGEVGQVWAVAPPVVYRSLNHLHENGFIEPRRTEAGDRGPQRTVFAATRRGRVAARGWLRRPVEHVRDVRSELLLKLALLARVGVDPAPLIGAQRAALEPIRAGVARRPAAGDEPARLLGQWRTQNVHATLRFLDAIEQQPVPATVGAVTEARDPTRTEKP